MFQTTQDYYRRNGFIWLILPKFKEKGYLLCSGTGWSGKQFSAAELSNRWTFNSEMPARYIFVSNRCFTVTAVRAHTGTAVSSITSSPFPLSLRCNVTECRMLILLSVFSQNKLGIWYIFGFNVEELLWGIFSSTCKEFVHKMDVLVGLQQKFSNEGPQFWCWNQDFRSCSTSTLLES